MWCLKFIPKWMLHFAEAAWFMTTTSVAWFCIIVCSHVSSKGEAMILVMLWSFQITLANLNRVPRGTSFSATFVSAGNATPTNIGFIRIRTHLHATWTPMRSTCGAIEISVCTWQIRSLKRSSSAPHALTSTSLKVNMSLGTTKSCCVFHGCFLCTKLLIWLLFFLGGACFCHLDIDMFYFNLLGFGSQKSTKVTLPSSRICEGVGESQHERLVEYKSLYERSPPEDWWGWSFFKNWWTSPGWFVRGKERNIKGATCCAVCWFKTISYSII